MKAAWRISLAAVLSACILLALVPSASARSLNGTISGLVLNPSGKPVAGVRVVVFQPRVIGLPPSDWEALEVTARTGRNGQYKLSVPPGTYRVWFVPADLETYCMEAYPNAPTPYHGTDVIVRAGRTTDRVSIRLDRDPARIEGVVYDASTPGHDPIAGLEMGLVLQGYALVNGIEWTETDAAGHYVFGGLKPYDWGVLNREGGPFGMLILGLYDWSIDTPGEVETIDFDLQPFGFINLRGRLVGAGPDPAVGVPDTEVVYYIPDPDEGWYPAGSVTTDADGYFEIPDVPAGDSFEPTGLVVLEANGDFEFRFYTQGLDPWGADPLQMKRGVTLDIGDWPVAPAL